MTQQPETIDRRSKIILGVDDSREMQKLLQGIICHAGYTYIGANSANKALAEIAARNPFDLILLDVEMPGMNGFSTCARIRSNSKGKMVPIIFLTFNNTMADIDNCKAAGGDAFVVKPFTGKVLLQHIEHWLSRAALPPSAPEVTAEALARILKA
jgi:CheY-like chemotaxis protein